MCDRVREAPKKGVIASGCPYSHVADVANPYLGLLSGNGVDVIVAAATQDCLQKAFTGKVICMQGASASNSVSYWRPIVHHA